MKYKTSLLLSTSFLLLLSCGNGGNSQSVDSAPGSSGSAPQATSSEFVCPTVEAGSGDGFVPSLPESQRSGNILHCFDWTFAQIESELDTIAEAGFRVVQTSPVTQPKASGSAWFYLYQPVSFSIATSGPLGGERELQSLCAAAHERGISVIVDIVANHLATTGQTDSEGFMVIDPEVQTYEPEVYANQSLYFHRIAKPEGSGVDTMTYPGLPDLNTGNEYIQDKIYGLLKQCIDVGVDGFRFDAAKHIELSSDPNYPSNFWENTLGKAETYYQEKNGKPLMAYGEILGGIATGRDLKGYTDLMKVTDSDYINMGLSLAVNNKGKADRACQTLYGKATDPSNLVLWAESHDTWCAEEKHINDGKIAREWAFVGSRKDAQALYFSRPDTENRVGRKGSLFFSDPIISSVNWFANRYEDYDEYLHPENDNLFAINERYSEKDGGAVIIDLALQGAASLSFEHLPDGLYYDQVQGAAVQIENGKGCVSFDERGVAVLTPSKKMVKPTISVSREEGSYIDPFDFVVTVSDAATSSYSIDDGAEVPFSGKATIKIGEGATAGDVTTVTVKYSSGAYNGQKTYRFTKIALLEDGFNVVNFSANYANNNDIRIWSWGGDEKGVYSDNSEYHANEGILLVKDLPASRTGFLIAIFNKGAAPEVGSKTWVTPLKQTGDINPKSAYFDASDF